LGTVLWIGFYAAVIVGTCQKQKLSVHPSYNWLEQMKNGTLVLEMRGMLNTIADEIRRGLVADIRAI
jgi:hypothetical protein